LSYSHLLLALSVVFVWGTNFVVIRWGLDGLPPFLFATLRFTFSALPWLLFIRRPLVPWHKLAAFGVLLGVGMFALLFLAMRADISPGLASLVIQVQVFFTIGLSMLTLGERVRGFQVTGLMLTVAGLALIAAHLDASLTAKGLALVLGAAFFWACANMVAKAAGRVDMLGFMVWTSLVCGAAFICPVVLAGRPATHAAKRAAGQPGCLGQCTVASSGQHAIWLRCLELAAGAPSGRHCDTAGDVGAGVWHRGISLVAG